MKVVQVLFSGLGGHGSVALSMIKADKKSLWDHHLVFFGIESIRAEYISECKKLKVPYFEIIKGKGLDVSAEKQYYTALKRIKPDVIILHSINLIIPTYLYSIFNSVRVISVEHTPNQVKTKFEWIFSLLACWLSKSVVFLTETHKKEVLDKFGIIYKCSSKIIANGIEINKFIKKEQSKHQNINIGMMARMSNTKDQYGLINAFQILNRGFEEVRLLLAGDGENFEMLKNYVLSNNIKNVLFLGNLNEAELIKYLNSLDIYAHSTLGETMSTSVMQAMSMGLPVVGSDIPGVNNLVENKVNGLLVEKGNVEQLVSALRKLVKDKELRKKYGRKSRELAIEKLSNERMFNDYNDIIGV